MEYSLATTSPIATCREEGATNGFTPQTLMCVLQQNRRCLGPVLTCSSIAEWLHNCIDGNGYTCITWCMVALIYANSKLYIYLSHTFPKHCDKTAGNQASLAGPGTKLYMFLRMHTVTVCIVCTHQTVIQK